jgi:hypothetical protein
MLKFTAGVVTGIYIAQQYPKDVPPLKPILDRVIIDVQQKVAEYSRPPPKQ